MEMSVSKHQTVAPTLREQLKKPGSTYSSIAAWKKIDYRVWDFYKLK